jgi:hypothetical protein
LTGIVLRVANRVGALEDDVVTDEPPNDWSEITKVQNKHELVSRARFAEKESESHKQDLMMKGEELRKMKWITIGSIATAATAIIASIPAIINVLDKIFTLVFRR